MQNLLLAVDRLSTWIGKVFAWTIVGLTLLISWEVFSRYVMNKPHAWMLDAQIMLYGTLFMTAGAYTLSRNGHVRGDLLVEEDEGAIDWRVRLLLPLHRLDARDVNRRHVDLATSNTNGTVNGR